MRTCSTIGRWVWILALSLVAYAFSSPCLAQDPLEFMPLHAWGILGETGEDDATSRLAEGFPGLHSESGKDRWIEPVDGAGGFDNVAPRLSAEEGPGGLEWDLSPTYRTRHQDGTDYSGGLQGNNWFPGIPFATYDATNDEWTVRFDANTVRVYDVDSQVSTVYWGRYGNGNSKIKVTTGTKIELNDIGGKVYTFTSAESYRCTEIKGLGGAKVTIGYASGTITVKQNDGTSDVRQLTYTITDHGSGERIDRIDVAEWTGSAWDTYRTIEFTYHEQVTGAVGSGSGDLIGIEDTRDLSESGKSYTRKWVFKYYTGTYNSSTNPGSPYQVAAVIGPGSVKAFEVANPSLDIYKRSVSQLSGYSGRTYEYHSDKRLRDLVLEDSCGCGGTAGAYSYTWDVNGTTPSDLGTWFRRVNITLPTGAKLMVDYNKYGQTHNRVLQEVASDSNSRRWITAYRRDAVGRLTDIFSVPTCLTYYDSTHLIGVSTTEGMRLRFTYDSSGALSTVKLSKGYSGAAYYQRKTAFTLRTSGDRRRFFKTSEKRYPSQTTSDSGSEETTFSYTYHTGDALAVKQRTTTLPAISIAGNGSGSTVSVYDYFEIDGLHTWSKDGEGNVHYRGFDPDLRVPTITVVDVDTDAGDRPAGVPAAPETTFQSSSGLNILSEMEYDALGRLTKNTGPEFDAYTGTSVSANRITSRWHYSKLSGGELALLQYPNVGSSYYHAAVTMTVLDHDGNAITECQGELSSGTRDTDLADDLDETQSTISGAFDGEIIQRMDTEYVGGKATKVKVWSDADNSSASKFTTTNTYDSSGRLETTKTPAGTITRFSYDVLGRQKSRKVGTIDGGGSDNMTLLEELFYDDEEDDSDNVGDGFLTQHRLYTSYNDGVGAPGADHRDGLRPSRPGDRHLRAGRRPPRERLRQPEPGHGDASLRR